MEGRFSEQFNRSCYHKIDKRNVISSVPLNSYHRKNYCYEETTPRIHSHDRRFN